MNFKVVPPNLLIEGAEALTAINFFISCVRPMTAYLNRGLQVNLITGTHTHAPLRSTANVQSPRDPPRLLSLVPPRIAQAMNNALLVRATVANKSGTKTAARNIQFHEIAADRYEGAETKRYATLRL